MRTHDLTVFATGHRFLEGLRWHDGRLWASDFFTKHVLTFESDGSSRVVAEIPGTPSGLGFLGDGSTLVVSQADRTVQRIALDGGVSIYADLSGVAAGPANDMIVSSAGHAYVGNFGFAPGEEDPKPTNLAHIDPRGGVARVAGEVLFPNGMAITPDGVLLLAETYAHRISAFDIAPDGTLSKHRVWAQLDDTLRPDGIALDTDGGLWFGNVQTRGEDSGFYRVLKGGEITDKVPVADSWAVDATFGGEELDTLYMCCNTTTVEEFLDGRSTAFVATADVGRQGSKHI